MSAAHSGCEREPDKSGNTLYRFEMKEAIPSYLIAIAVGDIKFRSLGARTGVYAEPGVLDSAAKEFEDLERMVSACESLFGAYRWGRYDLLILPPSAPYGGMENPRLSFITPTVIAGDKSLVSLIAHELAHSWSGNLVTNATWRDFWLNEGFTVYLERRIVEAIYGQRREQMEDALGLQSLRRDLAGLDPAHQQLAIDLRKDDPDEGVTDVAYEKGKLFLQFLESRFGRDTLQAFLRGYFDHFAFQSIYTEQFLDYARANLLLEEAGRGDGTADSGVGVRPGHPVIRRAAPAGRVQADRRCAHRVARRQDEDRSAAREELDDAGVAAVSRQHAAQAVRAAARRARSRPSTCRSRAMRKSR